MEPSTHSSASTDDINIVEEDSSTSQSKVVLVGLLCMLSLTLEAYVFSHYLIKFSFTT